MSIHLRFQFIWSLMNIQWCDGGPPTRDFYIMLSRACFSVNHKCLQLSLIFCCWIVHLLLNLLMEIHKTHNVWHSTNILFSKLIIEQLAQCSYNFTIIISHSNGKNDNCCLGNVKVAWTSSKYIICCTCYF